MIIRLWSAVVFLYRMFLISPHLSSPSPFSASVIIIQTTSCCNSSCGKRLGLGSSLVSFNGLSKWVGKSWSSHKNTQAGIKEWKPGQTDRWAPGSRALTLDVQMLVFQSVFIVGWIKADVDQSPRSPLPVRGLVKRGIEKRGRTC